MTRVDEGRCQAFIGAGQTPEAGGPATIAHHNPVAGQEDNIALSLEGHDHCQADAVGGSRRGRFRTDAALSTTAIASVVTIWPVLSWTAPADGQVRYVCGPGRRAKALGRVILHSSALQPGVLP